METQIQIKIDSADKQIIKKAARLIAIGYSTFVKQVAMREARKILIENKEVFD